MKIDFQHNQAAHCENGVTSNLLRFYGITLSEPMVFGMGSGYFFSHMPFVKLNGIAVTSFRVWPGWIFKRVTHRLGIQVKRKKYNNPDRAMQDLDELLASGKPVGMLVGVFHLPYFPKEYRFHFNAHNITVFGKEGDRYLVSDPVMENIETLSYEELKKVRFARGTYPPRGRMYYIDEVPARPDLRPAIIKGIRKTASDMLTIPLPMFGIDGIRYLAKNLRKWPAKMGEKTAALNLAQVIRMLEEIGTGGAGFRFIYAAFLQECAEKLNQPLLNEASVEMTAIGDAWRNFAWQAARCFKNRDNGSITYDALADLLIDIAGMEEKSFQQTQDHEAMNQKTLAIDIQNLTKYYKGSEKPAVDGVTLGIAEGHIFGLLGPNGAGKTTMIRILCGLLTPTEGEIKIGGYSLKNDLTEIRKIIGVVPQEIALYQTLTAYENLAIYGGILGLSGVHLKSRIDEQLQIFGLEKSRNIQVGKFSGGMKRRLNLIVGLMHEPHILFLDEPTVGVDVQSKNVIIESLMDINQAGTTIIYTSHYLEEAEILCSSLAIIDEGRIITEGSLNEIRKEHNSHAKLEDIFLQLTGKSLRD